LQNDATASGGASVPFCAALSSFLRPAADACVHQDAIKLSQRCHLPVLALLGELTMRRIGR
jgi:hypothetical protein